MTDQDEAASLAPTLLLSMPQLTDPNFNRTVVLLCEHNAEGAFGVVLNRPMDKRAQVVLKTEPPVNREVQLWVGGPVEPQRSWILLDEDPQDAGTVRISDGVYLSTSPALLRRVLESDTRRARLLVGYAGWGPGQLEAELEASAWLFGTVERDLVFDVPPGIMWETAIRRLGADPAMLHLSPGVH